MYPRALENLIEALRVLPGVGHKSAFRMALYLLDRDKEGAKAIEVGIHNALESIRRCNQCRNITDQPLCGFCLDETRDNGQICVVESPSDVFALSQNVVYKGRYFVLYGRLSPLDGIGPEELGLNLLENILQSGTISELILATNSTVEGEATAFYIDELAKPYKIKVTRIAYGVPMGGELEYLDEGTLAHAFKARQSFN